MTKKVLLGQSEYDIVFAELKDDKTIRSFDTYSFIDKEQSYDNNYYLSQNGWCHKVEINGQKLKSGQKLPENFTPFFENESIKEVIESEDYYENEGFYCCECGTFHDSEQYYNLSYTMTNDCEIFCKGCVPFEDIITPVYESEDIFKSKDIQDLEIPADFEEIETLFCDSSGFGSSYELALTKEQAEDKVNELLEEHGELYSGLSGIGQFQVYVSIYKRK